MRRPISKTFFRRVVAVAALLVASAIAAFAHQQPTTLALIDVDPATVRIELQLPLSELELAMRSETEPSDAELRDYLAKHVAASTDGRNWSVRITEIRTSEAEQQASGAYREKVAILELTPPNGLSTRRFTLAYDVVMHQVVSHRAVFSVRNDWESGRLDGGVTEAGVIMVDTASTEIRPLEINLEKGGAWAGFKGMVALGMRHIAEGTDHLLFLLALLLPSLLIADGGRWRGFGGTSTGLRKLLGIVTAFTAGHSLTLVAGALGIVSLPARPVEILIAVSILVSAIHAVKPIFAGRETYVAAGFGLIHGLAFAGALAALNLSPGYFALSVFGFNLGIEIMQLFVIALVAPWLILLAKTPVYTGFRMAGAILAAVAATGWIAERVSSTPNRVASLVADLAASAHLAIPLLAVLATLAYLVPFITAKIGRLSAAHPENYENE